MGSDAEIRVRSYFLVLVPKLINEFVGTFFLVLVGCLSRQLKFECVRLASSMAIGSMLMVVVFMGGHISGGHYNPSVTLGVYLSGCKRGQVNTVDTFFYIVVQFAASLAAAVCQWAITQDTIGINRAPRITVGGALLVEALFTFILVTVVLHVATTTDLEHNSFYGTAIGFTVIAGAICVGQISGGVFNPAIVFGPSMINAASMTPEPQFDTWLYYVGCVIGSLAAAFLFRIQSWGRAYGERYMQRVTNLGVEINAEVVMNNRNPGEEIEIVAKTPVNRPSANGNNNYCAGCGRSCGCLSNNNLNNLNNPNTPNNNLNAPNNLNTPNNFNTPNNLNTPNNNLNNSNFNSTLNNSNLNNFNHTGGIINDDLTNNNNRNNDLGTAGLNPRSYRTRNSSTSEYLEPNEEENGQSNEALLSPRMRANPLSKAQSLQRNG